MCKKRVEARAAVARICVIGSLPDAVGAKTKSPTPSTSDKSTLKLPMSTWLKGENSTSPAKRNVIL